MNGKPIERRSEGAGSSSSFDRVAPSQERDKPERFNTGVRGRIGAVWHEDLEGTSFSPIKEEALSSIVYSYRHGFSGFAAMLTDSQAQQIRELPEVISIKVSSSLELHTTRSWDYLGLSYDQHQPMGLLQRGTFGEDIIIGVVDSGKHEFSIL
ncbi:hypothetical protein ZIOFF_041501 [Zingiber officinale]|uniref:Inhibitor I9 domain-containing protein n=1 Tax=Zingiber officinale TaxID=94328 RepID=A0A8J5G736_ZINOF|nr:hypothetical protein ZIOFF_041501 [Zingiber officinale]